MSIVDKVAFERYLARYTDDHGMFTLDVWNNVYDNENPSTFTSYLVSCAAHKDVLTPEYCDRIVNFVNFIQVSPGLFRRRLSEDLSNVSHDEYSGLCILSAYVPGLTQKINEIVAYGKAYNWQYNDKQPKVDGFKYLLRSPVESIKYLYHRIRGGSESNEDLDNLQYFRQPRDIALYKLMSTTDKANWFELLYLYASFIITASGSAEANGGTRLLAFYKILALERINHSNWIFNKVASMFRQKLAKKHGENYVEELHKMYFKVESHPIHVLCQGLN